MDTDAQRKKKKLIMLKDLILRFDLFKVVFNVTDLTVESEIES